MQNNFDRFTERGKIIVRLAQEEARLFKHDAIGTEHLLLAIAREGQGVGARVLVRLGADTGKLRAALKDSVGMGTNSLQKAIDFDEQAIHALNAAMKEAQRLQQHYVGSEHILLGITHVTESKAEAMLKSLDVSFKSLKMRLASIQVLSTSSPQVLEHSPNRAQSTSRPGDTGGYLPIVLRDKHNSPAFTERALGVIQLAREEALRLQHSYIGTEHILLGLLRENDGAAASIFQTLDIRLTAVRSALDQVVSRGDQPVQGEISFNPRAQRVLERAHTEAQAMSHHYVGTEHILLGMMNTGESIATKILESFGGTEKVVREETLRVLGVTGSNVSVSSSGSSKNGRSNRL